MEENFIFKGLKNKITSVPVAKQRNDIKIQLLRHQDEFMVKILAPPTDGLTECLKLIPILKKGRCKKKGLFTSTCKRGIKFGPSVR